MHGLASETAQQSNSESSERQSLGTGNDLPCCITQEKVLITAAEANKNEKLAAADIEPVRGLSSSPNIPGFCPRWVIVDSRRELSREHD